MHSERSLEKNMSIAAIIQDPETDQEKQFYVPIATERWFRDVWLKLAQELQLEWVPLFRTGVQVEKHDLSAVLEELDRLDDLARRKLAAVELAQLTERLTDVRDALSTAFEREGAIIYIG